MKKFKRIVAGVLAAVTMAATGVTAFADAWSIDYTYGAPSSVSNQFTTFTHSGYSLKYATVYCNSVNVGGVVELISTGFNPNANSVTFTHSSDPLSVTLKNPSPDTVTVELWARANRVIADGYVWWF